MPRQNPERLPGVDRRAKHDSIDVRGHPPLALTSRRASLGEATLDLQACRALVFLLGALAFLFGARISLLRRPALLAIAISRYFEETVVGEEPRAE